MSMSIRDHLPTRINSSLDYCAEKSVKGSTTNNHPESQATTTVEYFPLAQPASRNSKLAATLTAANHAHGEPSLFAGKKFKRIIFTGNPEVSESRNNAAGGLTGVQTSSNMLINESLSKVGGNLVESINSSPQALKVFKTTDSVVNQKLNAGKLQVTTRDAPQSQLFKGF